MEQVQNREHPRRHVQNVEEKVRLFIHSSPSSEQYRMYRPVRTVTEPVKSSVRSVQAAVEPVMFPTERRISVSIPAGIDNGQSVRIREKGEPGVNGGPRGDLLVEVVVSRHPIFQRQDMHIFSTVPISFAQAALGADVKIKTVDGDVIYTVKPGTKTGTKVRSQRQGSSFYPKCKHPWRSLCNTGDPDTGTFKCRSERSTPQVR